MSGIRWKDVTAVCANPSITEVEDSRDIYQIQIQKLEDNRAEFQLNSGCHDYKVALWVNSTFPINLATAEISSSFNSGVRN